MTSSPGASSVTPRAMCSTTPATSEPAMRPAGRSGAAMRTRAKPRSVSQSAALTDEARTRTRTCPSRSSGTGTSRSSTNSGPPYLGWTIARMSLTPSPAVAAGAPA